MKGVIYYDLVAKGSRDLNILANLRAKKSLSDLVLGDILRELEDLDDEGEDRFSDLIGRSGKCNRGARKAPTSNAPTTGGRADVMKMSLFEIHNPIREHLLPHRLEIKLHGTRTNPKFASLTLVNKRGITVLGRLRPRGWNRRKHCRVHSTCTFHLSAEVVELGQKELAQG